MQQHAFDIFLSGEEVDLAVLTSEIVDSSNWYRWFNDESNLTNMQKHYFPNTKSMQHKLFNDEIEGSVKKLQLGIIDKKDNVLIGTISLSNIDYISRKCEISGFIGEKKYQSMKPFLEANKLIIRHAFNELNLHRIYGGSLSQDVINIYCRLLGFKSEGVLEKDVFKGGKYRDVFNIGLLKTNCTFLTET
jgi:RimJ/RimL family protein N-acetyltransferase